MTEYTQKVLAKQFRQGKRLTLILLLYGMAVTVLAFFTHVMEAVPWLLPFAISSIPFDRWFNPVYIFLTALARQVPILIASNSLYI